MPSCAIKWCGKHTTTSSHAKDGISFHRFPRDAENKKIWIQATQRCHYYPSKHSVICSRHFTEDCFDYMKNHTRRLLQSSIPTLYLPCLMATPETYLKQVQSASSSQDDKNTPTSTGTDVDHKEPVDLEKLKLKRRIIHLTNLLKKKNVDMKRLQSKTRHLQKKVARLQESLDTVANAATGIKEKRQEICEVYVFEED